MLREQAAHRPQLCVCHVRDTDLRKRDGEVNREHECDILVQLCGVRVVEDELADNAKGDCDSA